MEITGERALENITESQMFTLVVAQPDQDNIALDVLLMPSIRILPIRISSS